MIKFIKRDFKVVREALGYMFNREIPLGIAILYYIIGLFTITPIAAIIALYYKIRLSIEVRQMNKWLKSHSYEEA